MDVAEIREQIPGLRFGVYLNTGGVGQAPASVSQAITAGYQLMADGRLSPIDWYEAMEQGRLRDPCEDRRLLRSRLDRDRLDHEHRRRLWHGVGGAALGTG